MPTEPIDTISTALNRDELIADLCAHITTELKRNNCDFGETDAFTGYAAKVKIQIELYDVDTRTVEKTILIGAPLEELQGDTSRIEIPKASVDEIRTRSGLAEPDLAKPIGQP